MSEKELISVGVPNASYKKSELVSFIQMELQERTQNNLSWKDLPSCDESYRCLRKLNKVILIKIYECLMQLD